MRDSSAASAGRRPRSAGGVLLLLTLVGFTPSAGIADQAAFDALASEIRALRAAPLPDRDPGRDEWSADPAACSGVLDRAWIAVTEGDCAKAAGDFLRQSREVGESLTRLLMGEIALSEAGWEALEGAAKALGVPTSAAVCVARTAIHLWFPPGVEKDAWLARADAVGDIADLVSLLKAGHTLASGKGYLALSDAENPAAKAREAATELVNQPASGITQSAGWFANIRRAAESFHLAREASAKLDAHNARSAADSCRFGEAATAFADAELRALDYLYDTRRWVRESEQQVFCAITADWSAAAVVWSLGATSLARFPTQQKVLRDVAFFEGRARDMALEARQARARWESEEPARRQRFAALVTRLGAVVEAVDNGGACADVDRALAELAAVDGEACLLAAADLAGLGEPVAAYVRRLVALRQARDAFFGAVETAVADLSPMIESCRFDDAARRLGIHRQRFDDQARPHSWAGFEGCWQPPLRSDPWPLGVLAEAEASRRGAIASAVSDAGAALGRARDASARCAWSDAEAALVELAGAADRLPCPADHPDKARWLGVAASERAAFEARWAAVRPRQEAYEAAWRDLLASIEEELFRAEQPQEAGRCTAADRVREMVGLGASFIPPAECPPPAELATYRGRLADADVRATAAQQLGRGELERLVPLVEDALRRCDVGAAASSVADLAALPIVCGADRDGTLARLRGELDALERRVDAFRGEIEPLARGWADAYARCSITGLLAVAQRITRWSADRCAASALTPGEQARVRALMVRDAAAVEGLAARREGLRARLLAKIGIAEGYLRTAREALRRGSDPVHGRAEVERVVADAFVEVAATPDVPHACLEDLLERLAGLGDELDSVLAALPAMRDPGDCSAWPGTVALADPATGNLRCECPDGTAWSVVRNACHSLAGPGLAGAGVGGVDCTARPGTLPRRDPATGLWICKCPVGDWSETEGRCVTPLEGLPPPSYEPPGDSAVCETMRTVIRNALGTGDRGLAERIGATARTAGCPGIDALLPPPGGGEGPREAGRGSVSSRNVEICVVDANSVLDDHYRLVVNGLFIGMVQNAEGGRTCYRTLLRGGDNLIELQLVQKMGKSTALVMSINGGEFEGSFGGSHDHIWRITAP